MVIRILEKVQDPELKEKLENGIHHLWVAAQWGADSHPFLWAAISEARKELEIEEEDERED